MSKKKKGVTESVRLKRREWAIARVKEGWGTDRIRKEAATVFGLGMSGILLTQIRKELGVAGMRPADVKAHFEKAAAKRGRPPKAHASTALAPVPDVIVPTSQPRTIEGALAIMVEVMRRMGVERITLNDDGSYTHTQKGRL